MASKREYYISAETGPENEYDQQAFQENIQFALLLSLVDRGLLTRSQFDRCLEELKKDDEITASSINEAK